MAKRALICVDCGDPATKGRDHCPVCFTELMKDYPETSVADIDTPKKQINVKKKGNVYEQSIVKVLKGWFPHLPIRRSGILQCTKSGGALCGDIIGWAVAYIETKNCKSLSMFDWLRVMKKNCGNAMPFLVFHMPVNKSGDNRADDWVVCRLEDFPFLAQECVMQLERANEQR